MRGIFRGLPRAAGFYLVLLGVTSCSEDAQFVNRELSLSTADAESFVRYCPQETSGSAGGAISLSCVGPKTQMVVEPADTALIVGQTVALKAFIVRSDGKKLDVTSDAQWSLGHGQSVEMSSKGVVLAREVGVANINALFLDASAMAGVTVKSALVPEPEVQLTVQGSSDHVTLPAGLSSHIAWSSKDVASCEVFVDNLSIDRRLNGSVALKFSSETKVELRCEAQGGGTIKDSVNVSVTRPKVWISAGESLKSVTVSRGAPVVISWTSADTSTCRITDNGRLLSSNLSGVVTVIADRSRKIEASCDDRAGNNAGDFADIVVEFESRLSFAAGHYDQIPGASVQRPVSIVFALDVTGSMAGQIETVKSGVQDFVSKLVSRGFSPRLGVIPFRDKVPFAGNNGDVPEGRLELTDDVAKVKQFVQTLRATGGGDANEAALGGIKAAVQALRDGDTRPDAVKIVMVVTDQPGHHGASTKDCTLEPVTNYFGLLSEVEQRNFKLFYSAPSSGSSCGGFASGQLQMSKLLASVLTGEPVVANRGGLIAWPFAATNLVQDVVAMLVKTAPPIDLACINDSVEVGLEGRSFFKQTLTDRRATFRALEASRPVSIARTLSEAEHDSFEAGHGSMVASRCCVSKAAAQAGDFGTCLKRFGPEAIGFSLED
jgi:hypothetical protein